MFEKIREKISKKTNQKVGERDFIDDFDQWLTAQNDMRDTGWLAAYVDGDGRINYAKVADDIQYAPNRAYAFVTVEAFTEFVIAEYAEFIGWQRNLDDTVEALITRMPGGVSIKAIHPRKGSTNRWMVRYNGGTEYYGVTVDEAIKKMLKNQPKVAAKYTKIVQEANGNV